MKWLMTIAAVIVVFCSIPFNYHFIKMFITGNHPDSIEFYMILIVSPFLPVIAVMNAIMFYKKK